MASSPRFCPECGNPWMEGAHFCVQCGTPAPGLAGPRWRASPAALAATALLATACVAVLMVHANQGERPHPLPRRQAQGGLPSDHPPIQVPPQVRRKLAELAEQAAARPDDAGIWLQLAEGEYRAGQVDPSYLPQAQASYEHVLALDGANLRALRGLGNVYYDKNQFRRAIEFYERYLEHDPENAEVRTDLASMFFAAGDAEKAIDVYREVIARNPTMYQPHFNLGIVLHSQGRTNEALAHWRRARELATDPGVRQRIDSVAARLGEPPASQDASTGARRSFQPAVEKLLHEHAIMGPRIIGIDWPSPVEARVRLSSFPMADMPREVREQFVEKLQSQLHEAKVAAQVTGTARLDLVEDSSGELLERIEDP